MATFVGFPDCRGYGNAPKGPCRTAKENAHRSDFSSENRWLRLDRESENWLEKSGKSWFGTSSAQVADVVPEVDGIRKVYFTSGNAK